MRTFQNVTDSDLMVQLALEEDHSDHVIALILTCELAGGAGVDPIQPPLQWQVWQGEWLAGFPVS